MGTTTDRQLKDRILRALELAPGLDGEEIAVSCRDGIVTLSGRVCTYRERQIAQRAAGQVTGVRAIANDVEIVARLDRHRGDTVLAEAAAGALAREGAVPPGRILVVVRDGWITLSGTVDFWYQRTVAEDVVRPLEGVTGVTNAINVKRPATAADVLARITDAFQRHARVDAAGVCVQARDGSVILTGNVRSDAERQEAKLAAWSAPGVVLVDDRLAVSA